MTPNGSLAPWEDRVLRLVTPPYLWSLPPIWRYGLVVVIVVAATTLRWALIPWIGIISPHNIAHIGVLVATVLLGIGPGLLSILLGDVAVEVFVMRSLPANFEQATLLRLGMSMVVGIVICGTFHAIRISQIKTLDSRRRLAAFAASTFEGIVESEAGHIVDCNEQFAQMLGYTVPELKGMAIAELIAPEDRNRALSNIQENRESLIEHAALRKDGTRIVVEAHGHPTSRDGATRYTAVRDITEQKRGEEALRASERRERERAEELAALLDAVPIPVVIVHDPDSTHMTGNRAADELLRQPRGVEVSLSAPPEVKPRHFRAIKDGRELRLDELPAQRAARGEHVKNFEFSLVFDDGTVIHMLGYGTPLMDEKGRPRGAVHVLVDVTEQKRAEEELKKIADDLTRSNADLEQFAYVTSHDLKEPLRNIASFVGLLERRYKDSLDEKACEYIHYIVYGVKRMKQLIDDLLEYSRITGKGDKFQPTDSSSMLAKAISNLKATIEKSGAVITYDELPTVMADAAQVSSLFQNLISNAIKYRSEEAPQIHISAERKEDVWIFSVRDNGIGIDPQFKDRIFIVFQRLHTMHEYTGTGIGLALCKRIVERHGGRIWVESGTGKGSTFFFTIPDRS